VINNNPEGLIALYDIDANKKCGYFGRWILKRGSQAALESALLLYRIAFDYLNLDMVYCRVIIDNEQVISFHESSGLVNHGVLPDHFTIDGITYDAIELRLERGVWPKIESNLSSKALMFSQILNR